MPTAARLVAAFCLALIAFVVSGLVKDLDHFPEGTYFGWFTHVNVAIGLLCGWIVMGPRAGRGGLTPGINNGVTGVIVMVLWAVGIQGVNEMVKLSMRNRYGGPFEAITDAFRLAVDYGTLIFEPNIIATLLVGAVLAGLVTEYAAKTWR